MGRGGQDAKTGQLQLLRAAAAALEARAGRSPALDKAAGWRDLSALLPKRGKAVRRAAARRALLPKRGKAVRRAAARRKQQQQQQQQLEQKQQKQQKQLQQLQREQAGGREGRRERAG